MERPDWTPVVLIASTVSLTVVTVVLLTSPVFRPMPDASPGPARPRHALPDRIAVWVGDLDDDLRAVLTPVWGDAEADRRHDATLNDELATKRPLAFYDLLVFNRSAEPRTLALSDGALTIRGGDEKAETVAFKSVAALVERGEASPSPALRMVLLGRGMLRASVEIEPESMVSLLVAFERRVDLGQAGEVATADGTAFRRRPMARHDLEALLLDPTERGVENL